MAKHRRKLHDCPNCGTPLPPAFEFCPTCGQENHELKVPFRHMVYEFVEGITHFDAKVWNTLRAMAVPGRITAEFLVGRRARYVPPVRLYIFVSLVFFFLLNALMNHRFDEQGRRDGTAARTDTVRAPVRSGVHTTVRDGDSTPVADDGDLSISMTLSDDERTALKERLPHLSRTQVDSVLISMGNPRPNWFQRRLLMAVVHIPVGDDANSYIGHLVTRSLSLLMFLLMPFLALLLKVFFARKRLYYEHLIFSIHTHTAFFLLFSTLCALGLLMDGVVQLWVVRLTWLGAGAYMLSALRRVYHRSWAATVLLSLAMLIPYAIAFVALALAGILFGFLLH